MNFSLDSLFPSLSLASSSNDGIAFENLFPPDFFFSVPIDEGDSHPTVPGNDNPVTFDDIEACFPVTPSKTNCCDWSSFFELALPAPPPAAFEPTVAAFEPTAVSHIPAIFHAAKAKAVRNNKLVLERIFTEAQLNMNVKDFNLYKKIASISNSEMKELREARRRRKNRKYAKTARVRRLSKTDILREAHAMAKETFLRTKAGLLRERERNSFLRMEETRLNNHFTINW